MGTFLTFTFNGDEFAQCIRLLLNHQSLIDAFACLVSALTKLQPSLWLTVKYKFSTRWKQWSLHF